MAEELLTVGEAAQRLRLKEKTLRRWIALRKIEFVRAGGRAVRIPSAEIDRVIERGRVPPLAEKKLSNALRRRNEETTTL